MAIKRPSDVCLEYTSITYDKAEVNTNSAGMIRLQDGAHDLLLPSAHDWPAFENDIRELYGLPKHRTRKAKDGGK